MRGNYPAGVLNDPNAPWNRPSPPECPECGREISRVESHADWCPNPMAVEELKEYLDEQARYGR